MASFWTKKNDNEDYDKKTANPFAILGGNSATVLPHPHYHVVAGVLIHQGKVLCVKKGETKYAYTSHHWEFPGGKVETGETPEEALKRELREELDCEVKVENMLITVRHDYTDFSLTMEAFVCHPLSEQIVLKEHEALDWLLPNDLEDLEWCEADVPIAHKAKEFLCQKDLP